MWRVGELTLTGSLSVPMAVVVRDARMSEPRADDDESTTAGREHRSSCKPLALDRTPVTQPLHTP